MRGGVKVARLALNQEIGVRIPAPQQMHMWWFVYILECNDKTLYIGITDDLVRRLRAHKEGKGGRYTRSRGAKRILYQEKYSTRGKALRREAEIKSLPRKKKLDLIGGKNRAIV